MSELRRNSVLIRVLNYLAQNGAVQGNLKKASKEIRVSSLEFLETCKFLFNNDIIGFFPRISRIGCNNRFGILLFDSNGSNNHILEEIYLNFLELPVSVIFKGENEIFAYVAMPDEFTVSFIKYLNSFHDKIEVKYNNFVTLKSWGRFSIPLPEGTTVDEFGVNFPVKIIKKNKSETTS